MEHLQNIDLFANINIEELNFILNKLTTQTFKKNEVLFHAGDVIEDIYIIVNGNLEICSYDINGNKKLITVLVEGDMFAESVAFGNDHISPFDMMATKDLTAIKISREEMLLFPKQVLENLIRILATKNTFLTHKLECLNKNTIRERLYEVLNFYRIKQQSHTILLPFNQKQLAEYLCVNRSSLSREIHRMKMMKMIKVTKQKYILNKEFF